jgi:hypothetical protein
MLVLGCSDRHIYYSIQQNRKLECQKLPSAEYENCVRQYEESYDTYRQSRDELLTPQ